MTKEERIELVRRKFDDCVKLSGQELIEMLETIRDQYVCLWYECALKGETKKTSAYQYGAEKAIHTMERQYNIDTIKLENELRRAGQKAGSEIKIKFELPPPPESGSNYTVEDLE